MSRLHAPLLWRDLHRLAAAAAAAQGIFEIQVRRSETVAPGHHIGGYPRMAH